MDADANLAPSLTSDEERKLWLLLAPERSAMREERRKQREAKASLEKSKGQP